jgi:hypothetical protein
MPSTQNPLEKIKISLKKLANDKSFLMVSGVSLTMLIIFGFWIFTLRASFISNPPAASLANDLAELKGQFRFRMDNTEKLLKTVEAKQQAKIQAANSLDKNMDSLVKSIDEVSSSSAEESVIIQSNSNDKSIEALKSELLKIEKDLNR